MEDRLRKFVSEHRDEFDVYEPRQELWQEICQEFPAKKKEAKVISIIFGEKLSLTADFLFMRIAAAVVLLVGCGLTLFLMKQQTPDSNYYAAATVEKAEPTSENEIVPELAEIEAYYIRLVQRKKQELISNYDLEVLGLDEKQLIDKELAKLDSSYIHLKKQLYTNPNTDKVMGAMIQNLQVRISVLNHQLEAIKRIRKNQEEPIEQKKDEINA